MEKRKNPRPEWKKCLPDRIVISAIERMINRIIEQEKKQMKHVTIKYMIENSEIPAPLIRSTIRQFGGFEAFKESAVDVVKHGIPGGFHGFVYYSDTVAFFKRNRRHILAILENDAECFGQGLLEMVQGVRCLGPDYSLDEIARAIYSGKGDGTAQIYNCLSWYTGETVCRLYVYLIGE